MGVSSVPSLFATPNRFISNQYPIFLVPSRPEKGPNPPRGLRHTRANSIRKRLHINSLFLLPGIINLDDHHPLQLERTTRLFHCITPNHEKLTSSSSNTRSWATPSKLLDGVLTVRQIYPITFWSCGTNCIYRSFASSAFCCVCAAAVLGIAAHQATLWLHQPFHRMCRAVSPFKCNVTDVVPNRSIHHLRARRNMPYDFCSTSCVTSFSTSY